MSELESLLVKAREILSEDCVIEIECSRGYMERLMKCQERPENWRRPLIPFSVSPLIPENAAVLKYKSGKVTMVCQNGNMLILPGFYDSLANVNQPSEVRDE